MVRIALAGLVTFNAYVCGIANAATPDGPTPKNGIVACQAMTTLDLSKNADPAKITSATELATPVGTFCKVNGTIESEIKFEVALPLKNWSQRYLQTGCGGLCGTLTLEVAHAETCRPALDGTLVVASNNMGHESPGFDASFGKDPQKRIDFAYRANHVTALTAKAIIKAFYGASPRYSYFTGCSDGGREALMEAQRFPDDFDGIAAGAPAMNFQVQNSFYHGWQARSNTGTDGKPILLAGKLTVLHEAVIRACDGQDGVKTGILADPRACSFNPASIACKPGADTSTCLTDEEVAAVRKLYTGPVDESGNHLTAGGPQFGSEMAWQGVFVPPNKETALLSARIASASLEWLHFPRPSTNDKDLAAFSFTKANFSRIAELHSLYDATNPDISRFSWRGGKLILWHGWSDQHISPMNSIAYFNALGDELGTRVRDKFVKFFLFPGMYHCRMGDGFSQFDVLTPLMNWVEKRQAPKVIIASAIAPQANPPRGGSPLPIPASPTLRSRPVYPYPAVGRYKGKGDPNLAESWVPRAPLVANRSINWAGSKFMEATEPIWYRARESGLEQTTSP